MIDPHVHCRDWIQSYKETIEHALSVAERIGLSAIFDMPNTSPPINSRELIEKRLRDADKVGSSVFYGVYAGLSSDRNQIREVVKSWREFFPRVIGLKMFAGHSVGNLGIIKEEEQRLVYKTLSEKEYFGVLVVHCEKEALLKPNLWDPSNPKSHSFVRPPESEIKSIKDQIEFAQDYQFRGILHIPHISTPESVYLVEDARQRRVIRISCGLTPHHSNLSYDSLTKSREGLLFKVNPSLRDKASPKRMLTLLKEGKIDWIETDHAPHTLREKLEEPFMSGFPGLPFYPHFIRYLRTNGFSDEQLKDLTHRNICKTFSIDLPERTLTPNMELHSEYEVDTYKELRR